MRRKNIQEGAKVNILKGQEGNQRQHNRRHRTAPVYNINKLVAIKITRSGSGIKLTPKFLAPYKVVRIKPHDRYDVVKERTHEGPTTQLPIHFITLNYGLMQLQLEPR